MQFSKELLKGNIEVIVLQSLKELGEAYGYQLLSAIQDLSEDFFKFQESTLYPLLYRLEDKEWIKSHRKKAPSGKERRYYALTEKGKKALASKRIELSHFIIGMDKILKLELNHE